VSLMVSLRMEGLVPIPLADLWRLFWLHLDEDTIRAIHPWILRGRVVGDEGPLRYGGLEFPNRHVAEREIRIAGRTLQNTWTYHIAPPHTFSYEIRGSAGFVSSFINSYREEGSGTRVVTEADLHIGRVPGFLQRRIARRLLTRADREDVTYVRRYGFRKVGELASPKGT